LVGGKKKIRPEKKKFEKSRRRARDEPPVSAAVAENL